MTQYQTQKIYYRGITNILSLKKVTIIYTLRWGNNDVLLFGQPHYFFNITSFFSTLLTFLFYISGITSDAMFLHFTINI